MRLPLRVWATLVFGRPIVSSALSNLRESLPSWQRRMRPSCVSSSACLSINSNHTQPRASAAESTSSSTSGWRIA